MSIFAVLSIMTYQGLNIILETKSRLENEKVRLASLQMAMVIMGRDFEQIINRSIRDEYKTNQPALICGDSKSLNTVEFTMGGWRNPSGLPRSSMQRVAYRLDGNKLYRITWPFVDRVSGTVPSSRVILDEVTDFRVRILGDNGDWQDSWPPDKPAAPSSAEQNVLPRALEAIVTLEGWGEIRRLYIVGYGGQIDSAA